MRCTAVAPSNIAFIKYWGKRDEELKLPLNSSLSMTLDDKVQTKTTVEFSPSLSADTFILDGKVQQGKSLARVVSHLDSMRKIASVTVRAQVVSENTFPTAAGMASSASGFAALTLACAGALGLGLDAQGSSILSRKASGSSVRSFFSGFAVWHKGDDPSGKDSFGEQVADDEHWPELRDVIVIFESTQKAVSSGEGMRRCLSSPLMHVRLSNVEEQVDRAISAVHDKDIHKLFPLIMQDSDMMHAIMDSVGLRYMDKRSELIKDSVRRLNKTTIKAAYSFDAGPNAHIITTSDHVDEVMQIAKPMAERIIVSGSGKGARII